MRICFLNPFGTDDYDRLISDTLSPSLRGATDLEIRHLEDCPRNIDYYVPKHLVEVEVIRAAIAAEQDGFDAVVGLLGMLNVVLQARPPGEPDDPEIRAIEGWMLGRAP